MARFNEILVGSYNRLLAKLFGMKGGPPAPQLASEIQPVLPFRLGKETDYLAGWQHFGFFVVVAAQGAGNLGAMRIRNPFGSGTIILVYRAWFYDITNLVVNQFRIAYNRPNSGIVGIAGDLGALNNAPFLSEDARNSVGSVGITSTGNLGAVPPPSVVFSQPASGGQVANSFVDAITPEEDQKFVLLPGDTLTFFDIITNNNFSTGIRWKERLLEESERT